MKSNLWRFLLGGVLGLVLATGIFAAGVVLGGALPQVDLLGDQPGLPIPTVLPSLGATEPPPTAAEPQDLDELFKPFWEAWEIVHERYVDQPVDDVALMRGAIRGMLDALGDEHTGYMDPDQFMQANTRLEGEYEGIGAWVDPNQEYLTIIDPMPGSPAEKAGLRPGDQIIAIDGEDMTGIDGNLVIRKVLGPAGTKVRLTIKREGEPEPFDVVVTRARIKIPTVESEMLEGDIAYIRLFEFGEKAPADFREALAELLAQNPRGLILDLRGNPGGLLDAAVAIASEFLDGSVILIERFGDGTEQIYRAKQGGLATDIPLVVLVNAGSASASEIVAGAIQDHGRGILVGETTFGKGSVQTWHELSDQGAVRVTIARWYTPEGRQIHGSGLEPDVELVVDPETLEEDEDPQLEKAIEILLEMTQ